VARRQVYRDLAAAELTGKGRAQAMSNADSSYRRQWIAASVRRGQHRRRLTCVTLDSDPSERHRTFDASRLYGPAPWPTACTGYGVHFPRAKFMTAQRPVLKIVDRLVRGRSEPAGRVQHDSRGNAIWSAPISLEDTLELQLAVESTGVKPAEGDPYNSGTIVRPPRPVR
jgi:hypothetical protein